MNLKGDGNGPLPPLLVQYVELRERFPDYLVLFQVGDFYECFGEDAETLARALGLVLTQRAHKDFTTAMAGMPIRAADSHIEKLLHKGFRVAIADQVENPATASGLVKRDVVQLITPGTITEETLLKPDANYLAAVATGDGYGVAFLDISTGEFRGCHVFAKRSLFDELQRYGPSEVLLAPELQNQANVRELFSQRFPLMLSHEHFANDPQASKKALQISQQIHNPALKRAAMAVYSYALETQQGSLPQVTRFTPYDPGAYMHIDEVALATLEIFKTSMGTDDRTLFSILDQTRTAPGRRLLSAWLRHPLLDLSLIEQRHNLIELFVKDSTLRQDIRKMLYKMHDLERLATRLISDRASARDLVALARSLSLIPELKDLLLSHVEDALVNLHERMPDLTHVRSTIEAALNPNPPQKVTEGDLIQDGFDQELDSLRATIEESRNWLADLELTERQSTGIPKLKIGFNQVFGYYLEVTKPYYHLVPEHYRGIQTLKDRQRYTRPDLREKEREILRCDEAAQNREYLVFTELRKTLKPRAEDIRQLANSLAELDVYTSLAEIAAKHQYTRPRFSPKGDFFIRGARHAVVEQFCDFIANDLCMSKREHLMILTGPNMSGKSTYLRQNALVVILAQIGSFVPADEATLPIFKHIYTRIGANDDIAGGRSTFMVEMSELARILQHASEESLILLDEIGRGTSTYDGLSLAWAASEYLHDTIKAYTLFASHYFELTSLANKLPAARNYHVAAKENAGDLVFYHQVLPGPASKSYGLEVAKLAGIPQEVLTRASHVFTSLEAKSTKQPSDIVDQLLGTDLSRLSPLEALSLLHLWQDQAKGVNPSKDANLSL